MATGGQSSRCCVGQGGEPTAGPGTRPCWRPLGASVPLVRVSTAPHGECGKVLSFPAHRLPMECVPGRTENRDGDTPCSVSISLRVRQVLAAMKHWREVSLCTSECPQRKEAALLPSSPFPQSPFFKFPGPASLFLPSEQKALLFRGLMLMETPF